MKTCPGCGKPIEDDLQLCADCAAKAEPKTKKKGAKRLWIVLLALLAVAALGALIWYLTSGTVDTGLEPETKASAVPTPSAAVTEPEKPEPTPAVDPDTVTPAMWKVTDSEGHTMYLFGTIHTGDARNDVAIDKIVPTLDDCDALAVEFDLKEYEESREMQMETVQTFLLTDGSKVSDQMPAELYESAKALLREAGVYNRALDSYNLPFWSTLVEQAIMLKYSELDSDSAMDSQLIEHAYDNDQPVYSIESAKLQYDLLNSMPDELCIASIEYALDHMDSYNDSLMEMYEIWLSGDTDALVAYLEQETEDEDEAFSEEVIAMSEAFDKAMLDDRNDDMFIKAREYLASGETVFFAVGAAHMVGDHGLVQLLTDAGYTVERFDYNA